jgi:hypothetical protein
MFKLSFMKIKKMAQGYLSGERHMMQVCIFYTNASAFQETCTKSCLLSQIKISVFRKTLTKIYLVLLLC